MQILRNRVGAATRSQAVDGSASHCRRCHYRRSNPLPITILCRAHQRLGHKKLPALARHRPPLAGIRALQQNAEVPRPSRVPCQQGLLVPSDTAHGGDPAPPHHLRSLNDAFLLLQRVRRRLCPCQPEDVAGEEVWRSYAVIFNADSSSNRIHIFHFDHDLDLVHIGKDLELFF